jgi:hypothetical protein
MMHAVILKTWMVWWVASISLMHIVMECHLLMHDEVITLEWPSGGICYKVSLHVVVLLNLLLDSLLALSLLMPKLRSDLCSYGVHFFLESDLYLSGNQELNCIPKVCWDVLQAFMVVGGFLVAEHTFVWGQIPIQTFLN